MTSSGQSLEQRPLSTEKTQISESQAASPTGAKTQPTTMQILFPGTEGQICEWTKQINLN